MGRKLSETEYGRLEGYLGKHSAGHVNLTEAVVVGTKARWMMDIYHYQEHTIVLKERRTGDGHVTPSLHAEDPKLVEKIGAGMGQGKRVYYIEIYGERKEEILSEIGL